MTAGNRLLTTVMDSSQPPPEAIKQAFSELGPPGTPLTTAELATELGCSSRALVEQLQALVEDGELETKAVGEHVRIWWQPASTHHPSVGAPVSLKEAATSVTTFYTEGEMAKRIREFEWAETSLGAIFDWPLELRVAVDIMLGAEDAIGLYWGNDSVLLYNDAAREQIGDKHPEALGRPARKVFPEAWEFLGPIHEQVLAGDGPVRVEDQYLPLNRHGELEDVWWDASFSPIPLSDGSVGGVLNISFDITTRKQQEEELERQREQLASQLEQLQRQRRELERHSERLEEFTSTVTHDLRSPLAVISGRLQLYRETGDETHLDAVDETVARAGRLIDNLLSVAHQGQRVETKQPTDVGVVFEQAREGTLPASAGWAYTPVSPVIADRDRLLQLFENLLRNSVEHGGG